MNNTTLDLVGQKVGEIADRVEIINSELGVLVERVTALEGQFNLLIRLQGIFLILLLVIAVISILNFILLNKRPRKK